MRLVADDGEVERTVSVSGTADNPLPSGVAREVADAIRHGVDELDADEKACELLADQPNASRADIAAASRQG